MDDSGTPTHFLHSLAHAHKRALSFATFPVDNKQSLLIEYNGVLCDTSTGSVLHLTAASCPRVRLLLKMASNIMFAANIKVLLYYCRLTHAYPFYSPMISTENGNVKITSTGDVVLQPGGDGAVQVLTSSGEVMNMTGAQGPPVRFSGVRLIL